MGQFSRLLGAYTDSNNSVLTLFVVVLATLSLAELLGRPTACPAW